MDRNFNNGIEDTFDFDILYIGQAKGKNKKRNAIERLKSMKLYKNQFQRK